MSGSVKFLVNGDMRRKVYISRKRPGVAEMQTIQWREYVIGHVPSCVQGLNAENEDEITLVVATYLRIRSSVGWPPHFCGLPQGGGHGIAKRRGRE